MKEQISLQKQNHSEIVLIPSSIFKDRSISILESLVEYMHYKEGLSFHEIAKAINRDDRTIWTVHKRIIEKRTKKK